MYGIDRSQPWVAQVVADGLGRWDRPELGGPGDGKGRMMWNKEAWGDETKIAEGMPNYLVPKWADLRRDCAIAAQDDIVSEFATIYLLGCSTNTSMQFKHVDSMGFFFTLFFPPFYKGCQVCLQRLSLVTKLHGCHHCIPKCFFFPFFIPLLYPHMFLMHLPPFFNKHIPILFPSLLQKSRQCGAHTWAWGLGADYHWQSHKRPALFGAKNHGKTLGKP